MEEKRAGPHTTQKQVRAIVTTPLAGAAINRRYVGGGRFILSAAYRKAGLQITRELRAAYGNRPPLIGAVSVFIELPCVRVCRQQHNAGLPFGDIDAPLKCILDAIQAAGVIVDDSQITNLVVHKSFSTHTLVFVDVDNEWAKEFVQ